MKKAILTITFIFATFYLFSQKWDTIFGNPGTSEGFKDVIECYDKGYLISGSNFENLQRNWLIKTDLNKNVLWEKFLTWDDIYVVKSNVDQDLNGNIILASLVSGGGIGQWPWITKLDACGEKVWCRVFPHSDDYLFGNYQDVLFLENNDILALGQFESLDNLDQVFLDYIDSNGNLKWRKVYASQNVYTNIRSCFGDGIQKYGDNYIIHGDCYYPYPSDTTHFYLRPLFIMLDSLFNEKWVIPFGVSDSIIGEAYHTIKLNDSVFMGVGKRRLPDDIRNSILMFFNKEGEELGYKQIFNDNITPGLTKNFINDIARINDTLFMASSYFRYGNDPGQWGEMIIDTSGNIYNYEMRSPSTSGWTTMVKTFDDKYTIGCSWEEGKTDWDIYLYKINENLEQDTIYPGNYNYDSLCPNQIQSGEIDISDCLIITDVGEVPTPQDYFASLNSIPIKAYPNPANGGEITFEFQNTEHHDNMKLKCFDVYGKQVHSERIYQFQGASKVDIQHWKPGIYLILVYSNGQVVGQTKFLVQ